MSEYLTPEEVADKFNLKRSQVMKLATSGIWPHLRLSQKSVRFTQEHILAIEALSNVEPSTATKRNFGRIGKGLTN